MRASFHTLGCKLNYAETSTVARDFERRGFQIVPFGAPSEVTLINTCTVTEQAEQKARQAVRRALRANPDSFVIVTGCYAQLRPEEITRIPGVDVVLGAQEKFRVFSLIEEFAKQEAPQTHVSCIGPDASFGPAYASGERTRAFLKVQDGCDYTCAFCTIPLARGKSRSATIEQVVAQARDLAVEGYSEVVLSGVNIGLFGQEQGTDLHSLLNELDNVEGIARYRISSIEPNLLTDEIIAFVSASPKFQPHFHLPLQSGDDFVLGKMRRRYRSGLYAERVRRIKEKMPEACIGVDVIVGFPAETQERFENTVAFLESLPVSYLHVFTYSERPDTTAVEHIAHLGGPVPKAERSHRNRVLRLLSEKKRHAFYRQHLGQTRPVLWEAEEKEGAMFGFTDNYIKVQVPYEEARVGTVEEVRLAAFAEDGTVLANNAAFLALL